MSKFNSQYKKRRSRSPAYKSLESEALDGAVAEVEPDQLLQTGRRED